MQSEAHLEKCITLPTAQEGNNLVQRIRSYFFSLDRLKDFLDEVRFQLLKEGGERLSGQQGLPTRQVHFPRFLLLRKCSLHGGVAEDPAR